MCPEGFTALEIIITPKLWQSYHAAGLRPQDSLEVCSGPHLVLKTNPGQALWRIEEILHDTLTIHVRNMGLLLVGICLECSCRT